MANPGFALIREQARKRFDLMPGARQRLAWMQFRTVFNGLIQQPIWDANPITIAEWESSLVPVARFQVLFDWAAEAKLALEMPSAPSVSMPETFDLLEQFFLPLREQLKAMVPDRSRRPVTSIQPALAPLPASFGRRQAFDSLCATLRTSPPEISDVLLHGSLADGLIAEGFSDADVLCFIGNPALGQRQFWRAAQWLFRLNRELFAINPCMHHGPMVAFADELNAAAESVVPSAVLRHGHWLKGGVESVQYHDGLVENVLLLQVFESYFERHHLFVPDLRTAFDVLWWCASAVSLPLLLHPIVHGVSIYKRECLEKRTVPLPDQLWAAIDRVGQVRLALARWIAPRLGPSSMASPGANPGLVVAAHQRSLKLTCAEVRGLGVDDDLMADVRRLWQHVSLTGWEKAARALSSASLPAPPPLSWERPTCRAPRFLTHDDYASARSTFLGRCQSLSGVRAVFEFGEVGCPGLSDLDFCVVLEDSFQGIPHELTANSFDEATRYAMDHDPLFVAESMAPRLGMLFPIFDARQIHGAAMSLPPSAAFSPFVQAAAITHLNLRKYPQDLDWLLQQPELNIRTLLAFVHSAKHIRNCLARLGIDAGQPIDAAIALDEAIRSNFLSGTAPTPVDIFQAVTACLHFSGALRVALARFWRDAAIKHGLAPQGRTEDVDAAANFIRQQLGIDAPQGGQEGPVIAPLVAEYRGAKSEFVEFERRRGRPCSPYIDDAGHVQSAAVAVRALCRLGSVNELASAPYRSMMAQLNAFASAHGLREFTTWSKIWEYPWIWFHVLDRRSWQNVAALDLGSEISPMPWYLATLGASVRLIETDSQWVPIWTSLKEKLQVDVQWDIVDSELLPVPDNAADVVTSFSVIEHQPDKSRAVAEVVRVLKPGGVFAVSFDICEPDLGMTFPEWNGRALTIAEFERIIWFDPAFGNNESPDWNTRDLPAFHEWHKTTAAHHNYVVGAAALTKNAQPRSTPFVFARGWAAHESNGAEWWRWCSGRGEVVLRQRSQGSARLRAQLFALQPPDLVRISLDDVEIAQVAIPTSGAVEVDLAMEISRRTHRLTFTGANPPGQAPNDPRPLAFAVKNMEISDK